MLSFFTSEDRLRENASSADLLTNVNYSATQYALFSSMMLLLPKFLAGYSGLYVDHFGYASFFTSTAALGLPVLLLVWLASRVKTPSDAQ